MWVGKDSLLFNFWKSLYRIGIIPSLTVWLPLKPSDLEIMFVERILTTISISLTNIGLFRLSFLQRALVICAVKQFVHFIKVFKCFGTKFFKIFHYSLNFPRLCSDVTPLIPDIHNFSLTCLAKGLSHLLIFSKNHFSALLIFVYFLLLFHWFLLWTLLFDFY